MERLDLTDGFSIHDYRHGLKLLRRDDSTALVENREGYACPACGDPFDRLLVTVEQSHSFSSAPPAPICVVRTDSQLLVFTH
ncbi:MAG: flagella cluster protein [Halodesulfurarchaeum sp.]